MTKAQRRKLHAAINSLGYQRVADIVKKQFPRAKGPKVNVLAKAAISDAHRQVSPRKAPRG